MYSNANFSLNYLNIFQLIRTLNDPDKMMRKIPNILVLLLEKSPPNIVKQNLLSLASMTMTSLVEW